MTWVFIHKCIYVCIYNKKIKICIFNEKLIFCRMSTVKVRQASETTTFCWSGTESVLPFAVYRSRDAGEPIAAAHYPRRRQCHQPRVWSTPHPLIFRSDRGHTVTLPADRPPYHRNNSFLIRKTTLIFNSRT